MTPFFQIGSAEEPAKNQMQARDVTKFEQLVCIGKKPALKQRKILIKPINRAGIYMLNVRTIITNHFQENCHIVYDEESKDAVAADPGGKAESIAGEIKKLGLNLKAILLTHGHLDHVAGACELKSITGAEIIGPMQEDSFLIDSLDKQAIMFGFPKPNSFESDKWAKADEKIFFGTIACRTVAVPGHTPGHAAYVLGDGQICLTGDLIFDNSVGRTDFPGGSEKALACSIAKLLKILDKDTLMLSGHGSAFTAYDALTKNRYVAWLISQPGAKN